MEKWRPDILLKPSFYALLWGLLVSLLVVSAVLWLPLQVFVRACLLMLLIPFLAYHLWQLYFLRAEKTIVGLRNTELGWLLKESGADDWRDAVLLAGSIVTANGVFLRFSCGDRRFFRRRVYTALILRDSLDAHTFRRLKVFLRYMV